jgi:hypothetical protein
MLIRMTSPRLASVGSGTRRFCSLPAPAPAPAPAATRLQQYGQRSARATRLQCLLDPPLHHSAATRRASLLAGLALALAGPPGPALAALVEEDVVARVYEQASPGGGAPGGGGPRGGIW